MDRPNVIVASFRAPLRAWSWRTQRLFLWRLSVRNMWKTLVHQAHPSSFGTTWTTWDDQGRLGYIWDDVGRAWTTWDDLGRPGTTLDDLGRQGMTRLGCPWNLLFTFYWKMGPEPSISCPNPSQPFNYGLQLRSVKFSASGVRQVSRSKISNTQDWVYYIYIYIYIYEANWVPSLQCWVQTHRKGLIICYNSGLSNSELLA